MPSLYELQVLRAEDIVWASSSRTKSLSLYVKLTLGAINQKTDAVKRTNSPSWNTSLTLSHDGQPDVEELTVELKQKSLLPWKRSIGVAVVKVDKLLAESEDGEAKVELHSSRSGRASAIAGILFMRMKAAEEKQDAEAVSVPAVATTSHVAEAAEQGDQVQGQIKRDPDVKAADDGEALESMLQAAETNTAMLQNSRTAAASEKDEEAQGLVTENRDLLQSVKELVKQVQPFVDIMNEVASVHPYLNVTWQIVSSLQKVIKRQADNDEDVVGLVSCMKETFETIQGMGSLRKRLKNLDRNMVEFFKQSNECCTFIREYTGHGFIGRMLKVGSHEKIQQFKERFNAIRAALTEGTTLHTAFVSARILDVVDLMYLRGELNPAEMDASTRPQCLPGTRSEIIKQIMDWISSDMDTNMLWLHGVAGSGKSTVSTTIAKNHFDIHRQGAHLFFLRGKSKPNSVIRDIAFRLASFDRSIAEHVVAAVKNNNTINEAPLESQFEKLMLEPLQAAEKAMAGPVVIVLDALDECGTPDERTRLMKLLREEFPKLPPVFRFIVTSRPEADLTDTFSTLQSVRIVPLDYTSTTSKSDVNMYLDVELHTIFRRQQQHVKLHWEVMMEILGRAADGLFIWASTAIKMVKQSDEPVEELEDLVEFCRSRRSGSQAGLVELYDAVLENSGIQWHKARSRDRFAQILGLVLFSKTPVTPQTIDGLLGFSSRNMLSRLASVLAFSPEDPNMPVRLFHTSFSDYLLAPERKEHDWFIDVPVRQSSLVSRCFDVMADKLCFNICGLESSFLANDKVLNLDARIRERIPSDLQYACEHWAEHLCDMSQAQTPSTLLDQLKAFVQEERLLYWFEVLSVTGHFDRVANRSLYDVALWAGSHWPETSSIVWNAYRFSSKFSYPMSISAPHVYLSALSLGMKDFTFAERYAKTFPTIRSQRFGTKPPQPCLKIINGHTRYVRTVVFSLDGRRIASGSNDRTIRVWDADSGKLVAGPLKGHEGEVKSVAFSPDGRRIASGSDDRTIRVWDADSGKLIAGPFEGHQGVVKSVTFSPDGRRIASGSYDRTIRVWDVDTGEIVAGPFERHGSVVESVAFSPDGRRIASGLSDKTIRVWDVDSSKVIAGPFQGHESTVNSVAFSPRGRRIASGSGDKTIRVWDVDSGKLVAGPFEGHSKSVYSVTFSPDGRRIASGSDDETIRVWDADSGKLVTGPFEGHEDNVRSVAFSHDGRRIVSGSDDMTIRVWDVDTGEVVAGPFMGHEGRVLSMAFSPDSRRIASGSRDKTVRVWDVDASKLVEGRYEGHEGKVNSVAFSPDGRRIASGSGDKTIRVWDVDSGKLAAGPFEGHEGEVNSVVFSPDGRRIASGSDDRTIRVWDADSGKLVAEPFEGHDAYVLSVAFSPDGRRIASGSGDRTIRVWDVHTGKLVAGPFEGHERKVSSVTFSPDGRRIAASYDKTIRLWDVDSGKFVACPLEGYEDYVWAFAFSPDMRRVATGSYDKKTRVWDVDSGKLVAGPFEEHEGSIQSVAFSADGQRIASGSDDKTIRVWEVDSCKLVAGPFEGHEVEINQAASSPGDHRIASRSEDRTIRMWDTDSGEHGFWLRGRQDRVRSVASSPNDGHITSSSGDGTIRMYDAEYAVGTSTTSAEDTKSVMENVYRSEHDSRGSHYMVPQQRGARRIEEAIRKGWTISEDGWLLGQSGELIIWISEDIRRTLWYPSTTAVLSCRFSTKLDFRGARLGEGWYEGYLGSLPSDFCPL